MKTSRNLLLIALSSLFTISTFQARSESIILSDTDYAIIGAPAGTVNVSLRFGVWNALTSTFTQSLVSVDHLGYAAITGDELQISLNQTDQGTYTTGTLLALAIFAKDGVADSGPLEYSLSNAPFRAILTDSSRTTPAFGNNTNEVPFSFSANTTAVIGNFSFGGSGTDTITLVPEPTTSSLIILSCMTLAALSRSKRRD